MKNTRLIIPERVLLSGAAIFLVGVLLMVQYARNPHDSLLTYLLLGSANSGNRNLVACHVTTADFPQGGTGRNTPLVADPHVAGQQLQITGSAVLSPMITNAVEVFNRTNKTEISIKTTNSRTGIEYVFDQLVDLGLSDYSVDEDAKTLSYAGSLDDRLVAVGTFTMLASPDLDKLVWNLSRQQIADIYSGTTKNWADIGGPDEPITVLNFSDGTGMRNAFETYVWQSIGNVPTGKTLSSSSDMLANLDATHGAIGYAPTNALIKLPTRAIPLCIDGFGATTTAIERGEYLFWNFEHLYTPHNVAPSPLLNDFLSYICGVQFQLNNVLSNGFLLVPQLSQAAINTHPGTQLNLSCLK